MTAVVERDLVIPKTYRRTIITAPNTIELQDIPVPDAGPGQVLVKVLASALCTWEQRTFAGIDTYSYPLVGGHETSGVIAAVGPNVELRAQVGDRVAIAEEHLVERLRVRVRFGLRDLA